MLFPMYLVLGGVRKFDLCKNGALHQEKEFYDLFMGSRSEAERDKALGMIEKRIHALHEAYKVLWEVYNAEKALDCDERLLFALEKRVVPVQVAGRWKAPQYGVELVEYAKLAREFTAQDELDADLWSAIIAGFSLLKENLLSSGYRFTFDQHLERLKRELAESE